MGGLVVKQVRGFIASAVILERNKLVNVFKALIYAENDGQFHVLANSTAGVMFFGTPHRGSEHIKYGNILQKLANITAKRDISVMKKLQRDSDTLARLTIESRHQLSRYKVASFYETLETVIGPISSLVKCSVKTSTSDILTRYRLSANILRSWIRVGRLK
jgi:hypothetical protein